MDTLSKMCYTMGHETSWQFPSIGGAQATSHRLAAFRQTVSLGGSTTEVLAEFSGSMVASPPERRSEGIAFKTNSRSSIRTFRQPEKKTLRAVALRFTRGRTCHRLVDSETSGAADWKAFWSVLWPHRSLEIVGARSGLELSEAGAPSHSTRRGVYCTLEEGCVATFKKKPENLAPIWLSSTKADFCSFPTFVKRGLPGGRPRSCVIAKTMIAFPPSAHLPSRPSVSTWGSSWNTMPSTSRVWKFSHSCKTSCVTFQVRSSCCGTAARFTAAARWLTLSSDTRDFMFIAFQPMR